MPLQFSGTGELGVAVIALQASEREQFAKDYCRGILPLWRGVGRGDFPHLLRATLFSHGETITNDEIKSRGRAFRAHCEDHGIKVIMTVGSKPLAAVSPIHGDTRKLVGATIKSDPFIIIPLETSRTGGKKYRSHMWTLTMTRFVRRGVAIAAEGPKFFEVRGGVIGEGPEGPDSATTRATERALRKLLSENLPIGVDLETVGEHPNTVITAVGLANKNGGVSVPWSSYDSKKYGKVTGLQSEMLRALVLQVLVRPTLKVYQNGSFDRLVLRQAGIEVGGDWADTLLAHRVASADLFHNLGFIASHVFTIEPWKMMFDMKRKAKKEKDWADIYQPDLLAYNYADAYVTIRLWEVLERWVARTPGGPEHYKQLKQLAEWAADATYHGMALDAGGVQEALKAADKTLAALRVEWTALAGPDVPIEGPGSAAARHKFFFETLQAPVVYRTQKDKESLGSATLLEWDRSEDPRLSDAAWTLFKYVKASKSRAAFLAPFAEMGARCYAKPNVAGTKGTRMSYSEPNLQQVSKDKETTRPKTGQNFKLAPNLRHLFKPDEGCAIIELDYNALEARLVSYAANIPEWLSWLDDPKQDMHINNALAMFGRKLDKKNPADAKLRQVVKTLTYARFYNSGMSVGMVLKALKPSMPDLTESFLLDVFAAFDKGRPEVVGWQQSVEAFARKHGYVQTEILPLRQLADKNEPDMNMHLSFGIQSTAGNLASGALLRADRRLDHERGERILIQVHDAFVAQAPLDRVQHVHDILAEEMTRPVDIWGFKNVVFPVEGGAGPSWKDAKWPLERTR